MLYPFQSKNKFLLFSIFKVFFLIAFIGCGKPVSQSGKNEVLFCRSDQECQKKKDHYCYLNICVLKPKCEGKTEADCVLSEEKGICAEGKTICVEARIVCVKVFKPNPKGEICGNKKDDDCDGEVDESPPCSGCRPGMSRSCFPKSLKGCVKDLYQSKGYRCKGLCLSGVQVCQVNAAWGACIGEAGPQKEICDGKDNDCDGKVDDGASGGGEPCGVPGKKGPCASGKSACKKGKIVCLQVYKSKGEEICDNKEDDDCDGKVDEYPPCTCEVGKKQSCYTGLPNTAGRGECKKGQQLCESGQKWGRCLGAILPTKEICDGKDNDCNGKTDEKYPQEGDHCLVSGAKGLCVKGAKSCKKGQVVCIAKISPSKETCDGKDNDCDGKTDEGCDCLNGETEGCVSSNNMGCQRVGKGKYICKGICLAGKKTCKLGKWGACLGEKVPQKELCDPKGLDENCDGKTNENPPCKCKGKEKQACGSKVGACNKGIQTCENGKYGSCIGEVKPITELCNGVDDDCDGQTDEDFSAIGKECIVGKGFCTRKGLEVCQADGKATECNARPGKPVKEVCNGIDDDCDGKVDESFSGLSIACQIGVGECLRSGQLICSRDGSQAECSVKAGPSGKEVCDGKDNDCDGQTDEELPNLTCGKGVCENSIVACVDGKEKKCVPKLLGTKEVCDGKDNDCDGLTDENKVCQCKDGYEVSCYDGPSGTRGIGLCAAGKKKCSGGSFGACEDSVKPTAELCNGKDDDCNGLIDDSLPLSFCYSGPAGTDGQGFCRAGRKACTSGSWGACFGEVLPDKEVCDSVDNDCDGSVDEDIVDITCGHGPCTNTVRGCVNGSLGICVPKPPQIELCMNKIDDDCDGKIDRADPSCKFCIDVAVAGNLQMIPIKSNTYKIAYSPDGKYMVTAAFEGKKDNYKSHLKIWDATQKPPTLSKTYKRAGVIYSIAFSPNSKYLAVGDKNIQVWNIQTLKLVFKHKAHDSETFGLAFSQNGARMISAGLNKKIMFWAVTSGFRLLKTLKVFSKLYSIGVRKGILATEWKDGRIRQWQVSNYKLKGTASWKYRHKNPIYSIAMDPNGKLVASGSVDRLIRLWTIEKTKYIHTFSAFGGIHSLMFDVNGTYLFSVGSEKAIRIFNVVNKSAVLKISTLHTKTIFSIAMHPSGRSFATGSEDSLKIWYCP